MGKEKAKKNEKANIQEKQFKHKIEGPEAIKALFDAVSAKNIEKEANIESNIKMLHEKIEKLETEINLIKDLLARAINVKRQNVITD